MNKIIQLINEARYRDADRTWLEELKAIDEAYMNTVKAWLDSGEIHRARTVFNHISTDAEGRSELLHKLEDSEEAVELGTSVYLSTTPMYKRWVQPSVIPNKLETLCLTAWLPGRVCSIDSNNVNIVIVTPDTRRVFIRPFSYKKWNELDFCDINNALDRFIYVAIYGVSEQQVVKIFEQN